MRFLHLLSYPGPQLLVFVVGTFASIGAAVAGVGAIAPVLGVSSPALFGALASAIIVGLMWVLSAFVVRQEKLTVVVALGLGWHAGHVRLLVLGFVASALVFFAAAGLQSAQVGAPWSFGGGAGAIASVVGLGLTLAKVMAEELVFRGAGFRLLRRGWGDRTAILVSASLFGGYHLIGTHYWGTGALMQFAMPAIGGAVFAWAVVRTNSLLPAIGLHWGGNWVQEGVARFTSEEYASVQALWQIPIGSEKVAALMSPDLSARWPMLLALGLCAVTCWGLLKVRHERPATT